MGEVRPQKDMPTRVNSYHKGQRARIDDSPLVFGAPDQYSIDRFSDGWNQESQDLMEAVNMYWMEDSQDERRSW